MSKKLVFLFVFFLLLAPSVSAQTAPQNSDVMTSNSDVRVKPTDGFRPIKEYMTMEKKELNSEISDKRAAFKERLSQIKDQRKKAIAERINNGITTKNKNLTSKMNNALSRMTTIIEKLSTKSASLKTAGKDTTGLDNAISAAQTAIGTAKVAVDTQAAKEYTATIGDDSTLGGSISQMLSQFRTDITTTYQAVKAAKDAVVTAIREVAKISGENTATGSANIGL